MALEQAMKRARLSITSEGDDSIVIDRSVFASRKGGKLATVTTLSSSGKGGKGKSSKGGELGPSSASVHSNAQDELCPEAAYWRQKFYHLKRELREEEEDVQHLVEVTREREARLQELSRLLEKKLDLLMSSSSSSPSSSSSSSSSVTASNGSNSSSSNAVGVDTMAKLDNQRTLLRFYEQMTGLTLQEETDAEGGGFKCTVRNRVKRLVTRFRVVQEDGEATYTPLANVALLPEYLRNEIRCELPMLSVMLSDVLQSLYEDDEDDAQE